MNIDWLLDLIPRPDRSGLEGAICMLALLISMLTSGGGGGDLWCGVHPLSKACTTDAAQQTKPDQWRELHVQIIGHGPGKRKKPGHVCMMEERYDDKWDSGYPLIFVRPAILLEDCDDPLPGTWPGEAEWRHFVYHVRYYWADKAEYYNVIRGIRQDYTDSPWASITITGTGTTTIIGAENERSDKH